MPELSERTRIPVPLAEVWPLLSDPAAMAACIPGAELAPDRGDGVWRGSVRIRFGPTVATFRGEARLDFDHEAHRCTIEGRGIDQRGASRALSSGTVTAVAEDEATLLAVDGRFTVTGPLETFANAGGAHVARALLAEFSGNIARLAAEQRAAAPGHNASMQEAEPARSSPSAPIQPAPAAPPPSPPPAAAREMSAARLLWRSLLSWLRSFFCKRTD